MRRPRGSLRLAVAMADPPLTSAVLTTLAMQMAMAGEPAESTSQVAERALAGMHAAAPEGWPWSEAVRVLVVTKRYRCCRAARAAARVPARRPAPMPSYSSAGLHLRIGDLSRALEDARCARRSVRTAGGHRAAPWRASPRP